MKRTFDKFFKFFFTILHIILLLFLAMEVVEAERVKGVLLQALVMLYLFDTTSMVVFFQLLDNTKC